MPDPGLEERYAAAQEAAFVGSRLVLGRYQLGLAVEHKADGSEVTAADRAAEGAIRAALRRSFPADGVLGEEEGETPGTTGWRFVVDPLDGTWFFARGLPFWATLVAVEHHGLPLAGVIAMPALGETVAAARGLGCTWNGRRGRVSEVAELGGALVVAAPDRWMARRSAAWGRLGPRIGSLRPWGSAYGSVLLASGRAEVVGLVGCAYWDVAPLAPILGELGGRVTDFAGREHPPGGDVVASNGRVHDELLGLLGAGSG